MTLFTAGPWTVIIRGERGTFHIPQAQKHEAATNDGVDGGTVSQANANLIAAAPTMFEYIESSASAGCATAKLILEQINGPR